MARRKQRSDAAEIAVVGDVDDWEEDVVKSLLEVPRGGEVVLYIDSGGGSVYGALAIVTLLKQRSLRATAVVLGECSSAAIFLFAGCQTRQVTAYSTFLFHRMRWQSEKRVNPSEATLWARHFEDMERDIDDLQIRLFGAAEARVREWTRLGNYVTGKQMADAGLAELIEL